MSGRQGATVGLGRRAGRLGVALAGVLLVSTMCAWPAHAEQLILRPAASTAVVGDDHTLTATVSQDDGTPLAGVPVRFLWPDCTPASRLVTDSLGEATCVFTSTFAHTAFVTASGDLDGDSQSDPGEPSDTATVDWVAGPATELELDPAAQVRVVNTESCLEAVARDALGVRAADRLVRFVVTGANPTVHSQRTEFAGSARWCYSGLLAGEDSITAYVDDDEDGVKDGSEPGASATRTWLAQPAVITVSPEQSSAPVGTDHTISITVTTAAGVPLAGVPVRFDSFDLIFEGCNVLREDVTDSTGRAVCVERSQEPGLLNVRVTADVDAGGAASALSHHRWTSGDAVTMGLSPGFAVHRVGNQTCVWAVNVEDGEGRPAADKLVRLAFSGPSPATRTARTSQFGNAFVCYTGTTAGDEQVTAFVDNDEDGVDDGASDPDATATRLWLAQAPLLTLTPASGSGQTGGTHTLTARLTTATGTPIAGIPVGFGDDAPSPNQVLCDDFAFTRPTDADGVVRCTYRGRKPGTDQIRASADLDNDVSFSSEPARASATFTWLSGPADTLRLDPRTLFGVVGTRRCVTASAWEQLDDDLGPVQVIDTPIRFAVTGANASGGTVRTDSNGRAEFCYTPAAGGADEIGAFADNNGNGTDDGDTEPDDLVAATWIAEPPTISVEPGASTGPIGSTHSLTATVELADGSPLAGAPVYFLDEGGPSFDFCENGTGRTDAGGQVECSYTGDSAGTDQIRAFVDLNENFFNDAGEPDAAATRTWTPRVATSLKVTPAYATAIAGSFEFHCVTATAKDADDRLVRDLPVVFEVSGANPGTTTRTSDSSGEARYCLEGRTAGADTITAFADNDGDSAGDPGEPQDAAEVLWLSGQPDTIELDPATAVSPIGTTHTLTVEVADQGRPAAGVQLLFGVTGANRIASHIETADRDGRASFEYQAAVAGTDTITVVIDVNGNDFQDGDERIATATSVWTTEPPTALTLTPSSAGGPFDSEHCVEAEVRDGLDRPQQNRLVRFSVSGTATAGGSAETAAAGTARFCYRSGLPGTDAIVAYADTDRDAVRDAAEPQDEAGRSVQGAWLEIRKSLQPAGDAGRFALQLDGATVPGAAAVGHGGTTGKVLLALGAHTVAEQASGATRLADYGSAISCRAAAGTGAVVAQTAGSGPLQVSLGQGDDVLCTVTNVRNRPPECSRVSADPAVLWPPNSKLRVVRLGGTRDPDGDSVSTTVASVTQDEPLQRKRSRGLRRDAVLPGGRFVLLRAHRSPSGDGRVYRVKFTQRDARGAVCKGSVTVSVPRARHKRAVDSAPPSYSSLATKGSRTRGTGR
ncbi:MAG TPA: Ig-like domain-containing protein [Solirubrobacterales bacterium]|nr:Ig-like domain-containing protein [Solirubrobacterales bacterium]